MILTGAIQHQQGQHRPAGHRLGEDPGQSRHRALHRAAAIQRVLERNAGAEVALQSLALHLREGWKLQPLGLRQIAQQRARAAGAAQPRERVGRQCPGDVQDLQRLEQGFRASHLRHAGPLEQGPRARLLPGPQDDHGFSQPLGGLRHLDQRLGIAQILGLDAERGNPFVAQQRLAQQRQPGLRPARLGHREHGDGQATAMHRKALRKAGAAGDDRHAALDVLETVHAIPDRGTFERVDHTATPGPQQRHVARGPPEIGRDRLALTDRATGAALRQRGHGLDRLRSVLSDEREIRPGGQPLDRGEGPDARHEVGARNHRPDVPDIAHLAQLRDDIAAPCLRPDQRHRPRSQKS